MELTPEEFLKQKKEKGEAYATPIGGVKYYSDDFMLQFAKEYADMKVKEYKKSLCDNCNNDFFVTSIGGYKICSKCRKVKTDPESKQQ